MEAVFRVTVQFGCPTTRSVRLRKKGISRVNDMLRVFSGSGCCIGCWWNNSCRESGAVSYRVHVDVITFWTQFSHERLAIPLPRNS